MYKGQSTGGQWTAEEVTCHINVLELKAIFFALCSFLKTVKHEHILIKTDNTTAVSYINNLGGVKSLHCHHIAKQIWEWAISQK